MERRATEREISEVEVVIETFPLVFILRMRCGFFTMSRWAVDISHHIGCTSPGVLLETGRGRFLANQDVGLGRKCDLGSDRKLPVINWPDATSILNPCSETYTSYHQDGSWSITSPYHYAERLISFELHLKMDHHPLRSPRDNLDPHFLASGRDLSPARQV